MAVSEINRMLSGEWYNPRDPELLGMYHRAREILSAYSSTPTTDTRQKRQLMESLLGEMGKGVWIESPFFCDYGSLIRIGDDTFINGNCFLLDNNYISIGRNCLLGPHVQVYTSTHPLRAVERIIPEEGRSAAAPVYRTRSEPVHIGDNVWIGGNSVLLPGIRIGANSTIGAGSVVTKDIPADVLAAGNPCKVLQELK